MLLAFGCEPSIPERHLHNGDKTLNRLQEAIWIC